MAQTIEQGADAKAGVLHVVDFQQHFAPVLFLGCVQCVVRGFMHNPVRFVELLEVTVIGIQRLRFRCQIPFAQPAGGVG